MTIETFGSIKFNKKDKEWFGLVDNICPDNKVELFISVENIDQSLNDKIELIKKMANDSENIVDDLYELAYKKYKDTEYEVSRKEIEKMYFLTAVKLKEDNKTYWLTLEPSFNVNTIYNHFLRFTMRERKIIWANFDINTTA